MATNTEFMTVISPGGVAMMGKLKAVFIGQVQALSAAGLVRPISAPAARSERLKRLICSA